VPANQTLRIHDTPFSRQDAGAPTSATVILLRPGEETGGPSLPRLLLTPRQAAEALAVCPRTLWGLTSRGELRCVRVGRAVRYAISDLVDYVNRARGAQAGARGS
jgi:excisionase family DNA binding protein